MESGKESEKKGRGEEGKGKMTGTDVGQQGGHKTADTSGKQPDENRQSSGAGSSSKGSSSGKKDNR